jgi:phage shock protein E
MRFMTLAIILATVLAVAGCGGVPSAAPVVAPAAVAAQTKNLPADLDVATAASLHGQSDVVFLDVRTPEEYAEGHIPGVVLIPLDELPHRIDEVPKDKTVVVTCRSGNRSAQAAEILRQAGYSNVHNMTGGITAWQQAGYPVEK